MVLLSVIAEPLFRFLLTEKWLPMVSYFQILTVVGILHPFQRYNVNILRVKGRSDLVLKLNIIRKVVLIITIVVAIRYGIYGILISQCVYSIICVFLNTMYSSTMINYSLKEQAKDVVWIYILAVLIGCGIYLLDKIVMTELPDILRIIFGLIVGYIMYFGIAYLLKFEIINMINKFIKESRNNEKK
jgi:O-antigen/teichoic acid export membrane protein